MRTIYSQTVKTPKGFLALFVFILVALALLSLSHAAWGAQLCGNGICEPPNENQLNCPGDCLPQLCGDGFCDTFKGESNLNCPGDCTPGGTNAGTSQQVQAPTFGSTDTGFEKGLFVPVPGIGSLKGAGPAQIIVWFFYIGLGIIGVLALIMLVVGGIEYITGGINPAQQGAAKDRITAAVLGLILALGSFVILYTINPNLTRLKNPSLPSVTCNRVGTSTAAPGLTSANCVKNAQAENSAALTATGISGSGDTCLIKAAEKIPKDATDREGKLVQQQANDGCGYVGIVDDDAATTTCAVYCMYQKNDSCNYRNNPGGACTEEWGKAIHWLCSTTFPPGSGSVCSQDKNSGDDDKVALCPYLASYVSKIIDLGGKTDLCKCADTVSCQTPSGSTVTTGGSGQLCGNGICEPPNENQFNCPGECP